MAQDQATARDLTADQIEQHLQDMWDRGGSDSDAMMIENLARQYGVRTPWERNQANSLVGAAPSSSDRGMTPQPHPNALMPRRRR